jgi:hypothetical protein
MDETLLWYARLRWAAVLALLGLIVAVLGGVAPEWPVPPLLVLLVSGGVSNAFWQRRIQSAVPQWVALGMLAIDVLLLTHLLPLHIVSAGMFKCTFNEHCHDQVENPESDE